jgi:hypothetical protein
VANYITKCLECQKVKTKHIHATSLLQLLFQSLYLRLRSTVSRHPKVGKRWRREKHQPSAKETREDFYVGIV